MPSIHGPQWDRDEEYRQSVIRKALLLGFEAQELSFGSRDHNSSELTRWVFMLKGHSYGYYASLYSAAYDFLRIQDLEHLAGDYRG